MPGVYFLIRGLKNPSPIYLRFFNGRKLNVFLKTGLLINPKHWDKKKQRLRNLAETTQKDFINATLEKLSGYILERINQDYVKGISIDKEWTRKAVREFFNQTEEGSLLFTDYVEKYIEKAPTLIKRGKENGLSIRTIARYKVALNKLKNFENFKRIRLKISDINLKFHSEFLDYLVHQEKLRLITAGTHIKNVKVFCRNAKLEGYDVHKDLDHPNFFSPSSESKNIYELC